MIIFGGQITNNTPGSIGCVGNFFCVFGLGEYENLVEKSLFGNAWKLNRVNLTSNSGQCRNWNHQVGKTLKVVQNRCNLEGAASERDFANSGGLFNRGLVNGRGILQFPRQRLKPKVE